MTKATRLMAVVGAGLGSCALLVSSCGLGVIKRTSKNNPDASVPSPPLTVCDPSNLPDPSCAETCAQAQQILKTYCYACHGSDASGYRDVTDYHALSNVPASSSYRGWVYVLPGDPERSLTYYRTAVVQDMPPPSTIDSPIPHPSVSDFSVLYEWIKTCVPNLPSPDAGTPTTSVDAGPDGGDPLVACPADPPTGACSIPGLACPYSTQSCTCTNDSWACEPCPAAQPVTGTTCPAQTNGRAPAAFRCGYANVSCSCMPSTSGPTSPPTWACGVCPVSVPTWGQACGNTPISCAYADQQCNCDHGMWTCAAPHCPALESPEDTFDESCAGFYACSYPALHQLCTCQSPTVNGTLPDIDLKCTCPAAAPPNGSDCVYPIEFTCSYSDESCTCDSGRWHCAELCPAVAPADGSSCSSSLNCSYGNGLCYCDGSAWHCS